MKQGHNAETVIANIEFTVNIWSKTLWKISKQLFFHRKVKLEDENHKFSFFQIIIKGHNSGTIIGIINKLELNLCIMVIGWIFHLLNITETWEIGIFQWGA